MVQLNITRADKVLLSICILLSFLSFTYVKAVMPAGSEVRIEVDGKLKYTFPLNTDKILEVSGIIGKTTVEIKGGKVRIKEAPCPNRLCVHQGWVENGAVICLPNKVIVTITRPSRNKEPDAVSG